MEIEAHGVNSPEEYIFKSHHSGMEMSTFTNQVGTSGTALNRTIVGWKWIQLTAVSTVTRFKSHHSGMEINVQGDIRHDSRYYFKSHHSGMEIMFSLIIMN